MNYEASLLIKPINWFLENHKYFPQLSISSVTGVLLLHIDIPQNSFYWGVLIPTFQELILSEWGEIKSNEEGSTKF